MRKKARHREFLNEVLAHGKEFHEFHRKRLNTLKKRALNAKNHLEWIEKNEQKLREKEQRERIKALKENDFEAYINLINNEKNSRLLQILEQTHKYLEQLGAKVRI